MGDEIATPGMGEYKTTVLTESEHKEYETLGAELVRTLQVKIDDPTWLDAARVRSERLPLRLRQTIREFRHDPGRDGLLRVRNLPVSPDGVRPTPTVQESVEREPTMAAAVIALVSLQLGEMAAFQSEKSGALVQNVVPVPGQENAQSNAGSTRLEMHVENAFHPSRPDYVSLFCLRNDHDGAAGLRVASIRRALELIPNDVQQVLFEPRFTTEAPPSFVDGGIHKSAHPILSGHVEDPNIRVDFTSTRGLDSQAAGAMARLADALFEVTDTMTLDPGDLVVVDNRLALHGRTAFTPRFDGKDRWLHRTFVHLDSRRSREFRAGNGNVLS
jgi:L-asparagine oxygenase